MASKNIGKHPHYWKLKAAHLQRLQTIADARVAAQAALSAAGQAADEKWNQAMRDAGLDPEKQYVLSDADETVTLKS